MYRKMSLGLLKCSVGTKEVRFDHDLANLLGVVRKLPPNSKLNINSLTSPTTYFIHCDLVDREKNLFNGEKSDILACFDIKEEPWQKIRYHASSQEVLRDCTTGEYVNSITLNLQRYVKENEFRCLEV